MTDVLESEVATAAIFTPTTEVQEVSVVEPRGGVLRVPYYGYLIPDPAFDDGVGANHVLLAEVYSGLTRLTGSDGTVELDLAETYAIDSDGMRYEFRLRKDLKFSDGRRLTARDFKWSWERALDPEFNTDAAEDVLGSIVGARTILEGVELIDDRTLSIQLETPRYDLLALLAHPIASVLKDENVSAWVADWRWLYSGKTYSELPEWGDELPVGTGPFWPI